MSTRLCYIYIYHYRALSNVGIAIDTNYKYSFDSESHTLTIEKNHLPHSFWGAGVYSLSAIIGNNGVGKTTFLRQIIEAVVDGRNAQNVEASIVYLENNKFKVYVPNQKRFNVQTSSTGTDVESTRLIKIQTFFYSGHFYTPNDAGDDTITTEYEGMYNASDGWRLVKDLEGYNNQEGLHMAQPLINYLTAYLAQDSFRISLMLSNPIIREEFKGFSLPKYLIAGFNKSGEDRVFVSDRKWLDVIRNNISLAAKSLEGINQLLYYQIYYNLLNLIADHSEMSDDFKSILEEWTKYDVQGGRDILESFDKFVDTLQTGETEIYLKDYLNAITFILKKITQLFHYDEHRNMLYLEFSKADADVQKLMNKLFNSNEYLVARFFEPVYSQDLSGTTTLSSGELVLLHVFSRLYYAIEKYPQKFGKPSPTLLLLDEAEIGFHPEWQKKYIDVLIDFLNSVLVLAGITFQVVVTSHSPIMLSDIPSSCVNFLAHIDPNEIENIHEEETFASNIFDLYHNSFFLSDGMIGAYAAKKLQHIEDMFNDEARWNGDEIADTINIIGDEKIKNYFMSRLEEKRPQAAIDYYERKIEELRNHRNNE